MKLKTLRILNHLPILGKMIKRWEGVIIPGSWFLEWYFNDPEAAPVREYAKKHPDEVLTNTLIRDILDKNK